MTTAIATPKSLAEMTTEELWRFKGDMEALIREQQSYARPFAPLAKMRNAIDDELDRRGA